MTIAPSLLLFLFAQSPDQPLTNGGFESSNTLQQWVVTPSTLGRGVSVALDSHTFKEGHHSVVIAADHPTSVSLEQELFVPIGTLWRLTAWTKVGSAVHGDAVPKVGLDTPVGVQGVGSSRGSGSYDWRTTEILFRVPSPGRVTVRLTAFENARGRVWFDDVRLVPVPENTQPVESVQISSKRLSKRPIDVKQGGQFIEPLCNLLPSMIAQQVRSTSFEEEPAWRFQYKKEIDKPFRPWYPDGAVHEAKYSLDTKNPFNGKLSEKIELPIANAWAGISQDGFYTEPGHSYRLKLHLRSEGNIHVRAALHGSGRTLAGPVVLGRGSSEWQPELAVLRAEAASTNATLTIEFSGPGTLWLDRIYLIDESAVRGIWRPDVVDTLKAMTPGAVRFGGTSIESFEWEKCLGDWDHRVPYVTDDWGGLDPNFIGVEEFVQLCRCINAEPLICVRWTGKQPADAANEVEYFNGSAESTWGSLRARNGHREPYGVKYWQIGNEITGDPYLASLRAFAEAMKKVDPSIKLLSSLPAPTMLKQDGGYLDYLCPHDYSIGDLSGNEREFKDLRTQIVRDARREGVRLAVTEWNTTSGEAGLHRGLLLTLGNALICSRYQNLLHRYSDLVEIANRSNLSDSFGSGVIQPGPGWLYVSPTYYSQQLYQHAAGSFPIQVTRSSALAPYLQEPDLGATITEDGKALRIYAVNSTSAERVVDFGLESSLGSFRNGQTFVLTDRARLVDSEAMNSRDDPDRVTVLSNKIAVSGRRLQFCFAPFSVTLIELGLVSE